MKQVTLSIISGALLASAAFAQTPPSTTTPGTRDPATAPSPTTPGANTTTNSATLRTANAPQPTDAALLKQLALGGMAEVEAGRLATQRGQDKEVKEFGEHMVTDHSKANEKLKTLAKQENVDLPTKLDPEHASQKAMLEKHNGEKFDAEYMSTMVKGHEKTVALLQNQISNGRDPEVKKYAQETLPTVSSHLEKAKKLQAKVGPGNSGTSSRADSRTDAGPRADAVSRPDPERNTGTRDNNTRDTTTR
jgi:putative membrane protein